LPRHPAQLYEAACYLLTFGVLFTLYHRAKTKDFNGRLLGLMLVGIFISRLFIEGIKENQVPFEAGLPLNLGQLLSFPLILLGLYLSARKKRL